MVTSIEDAAAAIRDMLDRLRVLEEGRDAYETLRRDSETRRDQQVDNLNARMTRVEANATITPTAGAFPGTWPGPPGIATQATRKGFVDVTRAIQGLPVIGSTKRHKLEEMANEDVEFDGGAPLGSTGLQP